MILKINSGYFHTQHSPTGISDESVLCSLWGTQFRIVLVYKVFNYFGCTMAEAVICRPVTAVARVQFQVSPCEILCWTKRHWDRVFLRVLRLSLVSNFLPVFRTHLRLHMSLSRRTNGRRLGNFPNSSSVAEMGDHWIESAFSFFTTLA